MPAEPAHGSAHHLSEARSAKRRHRILARARTLEDIATPIDAPVDVARLAGGADLALAAIVVRLELFETERPVFDGRSFRDARAAIATGRLAHDLEVPRAQAPALCPVVERGSANGVHHRVNGEARRISRRRVGAMR